MQLTVICIVAQHSPQLLQEIAEGGGRSTSCISVVIMIPKKLHFSSVIEAHAEGNAHCLHLVSEHTTSMHGPPASLLLTFSSAHW